VSLVNIIGVFLEDGQVCTFYNFTTYGRSFESGDLIELPRHGKETMVVILGIYGMIIVFIAVYSTARKKTVISSARVVYT